MIWVVSQLFELADGTNLLKYVTDILYSNSRRTSYEYEYGDRRRKQRSLHNYCLYNGVKTLALRRNL